MVNVVAVAVVGGVLHMGAGVLSALVVVAEGIVVRAGLGASVALPDYVRPLPYSAKPYSCCSSDLGGCSDCV